MKKNLTTGNASIELSVESSSADTPLAGPPSLPRMGSLSAAVRDGRQRLVDQAESLSSTSTLINKQLQLDQGKTKLHLVGRQC